MSRKMEATFHGVTEKELAHLRAEVARIPRIEEGWRKTNRECIKHWNRADAAEATIDRVRAILDDWREEGEIRDTLYDALNGEA